MAKSDTGTGTNNPSGGEYQVFLSFRGPDTRRGFTDTLYNALVEAGIHVFIDNEELRPGEIISDNLLRAIDDSRLYIPIFSPNYASSHWCLRELAKMVENTSKPEEDGNKKVILPIFYNVEPDEVKLRNQLYRNDLLNLKKKFSFEDIETWKTALRKVGGISGLDLRNYTGDGDLSKTVVNEVVNRLLTRQRKVTEDLVGMDDQIAAINNLLGIHSGGVRLIGIYGMGGIGKTTLAKKIFNQLCPHFGKNCSFLDVVSETIKTQGLVKLQQQLLSDISNSRGVCSVGNSDHGINTIGATFCNKKVLIVLDDVDEGKQIQELIGMNFLYPGTRILVTTRDKRILKIRGFKYEVMPYEMEGLSNKNALQLFSRHAFDDNSPPANFYTLSENIVSTTGGLPLALQAIGSLLFGQKNRKIWEEVLEELRKTPHDDVLGKLRITYDALKPGQQQIFLDIACLFIGLDKTDPIYMWKDCQFSPEYAIDVLINRCMIKVLDNNKFWMHDQFRDLGRAINSRERSWFLARDDIIRELNSTEINKSVQALKFLNYPSIEDGITAPDWPLPCNPITVTAEQIKRFPYLRLLWLDDIKWQGDFTGCLSKLKWIALRYDYAPFTPTHLHLENVVVMEVYGCTWTEDAVRSLIKGARRLKALTLGKISSLDRIPTFSEDSVLEKLTVFSCGYLQEIDCSIGKLKNLQRLSLTNFSGLRELPNSILELKSLMKLDLSHTCITRLPDFIDRLQSLSYLNVSHTDIVKLPGTMSKLSQLHTLDLAYCNKIRELPKLPGSLITLRLISTSLQTVPDLSNLTNLVELLLSDASAVSKISTIIQPCDLPWIGRLSKLRKQHLCLLNVHATSTEWGSLSLLEELILDGLDLQTLGQLPPNLTFLKLHNTRVKQVELSGLPQLETLIIRRCKLVKRLYFPSSMRKLREVVVSSCAKLVEVQFLDVLISLENSSITSCRPLERFLLEESGCSELQAPELTDDSRRLSLDSSSLKMLQDPNPWSSPKPQENQFASTLESLKEIVIRNCILLERIGGLSNLKNLMCLEIAECESLRIAEGIFELERLEQLQVYRCISMERIIDASSSKIPNECQIQMMDCGDLPDTSKNDWGYASKITWKSYREKIPNAPTKARDIKIETTFSGCETETGDSLLEQGSARQLFQRLQGPVEEDTIRERVSKIIQISQKHRQLRIQNEHQDSKQTAVHNSHFVALSQVCPNNLNGILLRPLDLCEETSSNTDLLPVGHQVPHGGNLAMSNQVAVALRLPVCGQDDGDEDDNNGRDDEDEDDKNEDHENNDGRYDEVGNVHSSCGFSLVGSVDDKDESDDVDKEGEGEADGNNNSKNDEDEDYDDDGKDDEDNNVHEVLKSSCGPPPVCSVDDNDENNDVNEEGEGDRDEDKMRTRKRKRGTMKEPKRSKMTVMNTITMNTTITKKTMEKKTTTRATTTARTMMATRMTMCGRFCGRLTGLHRFIPWTTTMRRRKVKGEGELMATTRKRKRGTMKNPKRSKMMVMATTTMNTMATRKTIGDDDDKGATTMARTMKATRTTLRRKFCSRLLGFHRFISWTMLMRRRKVKGERKSMARGGRGREGQ